MNYMLLLAASCFLLLSSAALITHTLVALVATHVLCCNVRLPIIVYHVAAFEPPAFEPRRSNHGVRTTTFEPRPSSRRRLNPCHSNLVIPTTVFQPRHDPIEHGVRTTTFEP